MTMNADRTGGAPYTVKLIAKAIFWYVIILSSVAFLIDPLWSFAAGWDLAAQFSEKVQP